MTDKRNVYGWVNGEAVYTAEDFRYKARGFGAITNDDDLMAYAEKVTYGWSSAGHKQSFIGFYISDYAMSEPYRSLTHAEFDRLKELQAEARRKAKEADEARKWSYVRTIYWADNSIEEVYVDKDGIEKREQVTGPHGDVCY